MNQPWIYMCSPSWSPPTSLPIPSLWVFPVHQPWALVSCIQPGLAICFTLDRIHASMLFSQIIPSLHSPTKSKSLFYKANFLLKRVSESQPVVSDSWNPMDCSRPGSSIHGILQARVLECVAISFSRGSSQPRNQTRVSCITGRFFTNWAMRKALF